MIKYDYSLLRGKIREIYKSEKNFAKVLRDSDLKMSTGCFNSRINNKTRFKDIEMEIICELLSIPIKELLVYFFTRKYELNSYN